MQGWRLGIGRSRHQVAPTSAVAPPHGACGGEGGDGAAGGTEAAGASAQDCSEASVEHHLG
eukprot:514171-Rhodomonas_salina.1